MKNKKEKVTYICYTNLLGRWNKKLIEKFFNEPTKIVKNPHYSCAPKMKLYDLARVEKIETYKRFIQLKNQL